MAHTTTILTGLRPADWEHPADKAAMAALKAIPGLDYLVRQILGATADAYVHQTWLSSAVRVGPRQFSRLYRIVESCRETLDISNEYRCFVTYNPAANAMAAGFKAPCLVFHSSILDLLDDDELAYVVSHELGHAESGHALYHTLLALLIDGFFLLSGMGLTQVARMAIILALLEWSRKSELSADRAGLLGSQNPEAVWRTFMKMAGGKDLGQMNLDCFLEQAADYDKAGNLADEVSKMLVLGFRTHPMPVLRLKELKIWHDSGAYRKILDGQVGDRNDAGGGASGGGGAEGSGAGREDGPSFTPESLAAGAQKLVDDLGKAFESYRDEVGNSTMVKSAVDELNKLFNPPPRD